MSRMLRSLPSSGLVVQTTTELELLAGWLAGGEDRLPAPCSFMLTLCTSPIGEKYRPHVGTHTLHILKYLTADSQIHSCDVKGNTSSASFGKLFSVPPEEWEGWLAELGCKAAWCHTQLSLPLMPSIVCPAWPLDPALRHSSSNIRCCEGFGMGPFVDAFGSLSQVPLGWQQCPVAHS